MIGAEEISEILKLYRKHGWVLRRVLLSATGSMSLADKSEALFGAVPVQKDDFDGLWFSRSSGENDEAWELRRLTGGPYALVAVVAADLDPELREAELDAVASRMRATVNRGN